MIGVISKPNTRGKLQILSAEEENRMGEEEGKYVLCWLGLSIYERVGYYGHSVRS